MVQSLSQTARQIRKARTQFRRPKPSCRCHHRLPQGAAEGQHNLRISFKGVWSQGGHSKHSRAPRHTQARRRPRHNGNQPPSLLLSRPLRGRRDSRTNIATVFLTGASGFLGGHLLRELCTAGYEVRALSRRGDSDNVILLEVVFRSALISRMWRL